VIPVFVTDLSVTLEQEIGDQIELLRNFGLGYDWLGTITGTIGSWYLITQQNLDIDAEFSLTNAGSTSGTGQDASWLVQFDVENQNYTVTLRGLAYYFGSVLQTRFFFYDNQLIYDSRTGTVIKDFVNVLAMNTQPDSSSPLPGDIYMNQMATLTTSKSWSAIEIQTTMAYLITQISLMKLLPPVTTPIRN
jgi:hypothetical protein